MLRKGIPVAGGMAGGSADAAAALVGLAALWKLDLTRDELAELAAELGSDVTFALYGGTAVGTGRGERIVPVLARHPQHWVIALHRGGLSTPSVFRELDRLRDGCAPSRSGRSSRCWRRWPAATRGSWPCRLGNDLQAAAVSMAPGPAPHAARRGGRRGAGRHRLRLRPDLRVPVRRRRRGRSTWPPSWPAMGVCRTVRWRTARCPAPGSSTSTNPARPAAAASWPPEHA